MYHLIERLHALYELLRDERSKEIFQARFALDMERSLSNITRLAALGCYQESSLLGLSQTQKETLRQLNREHKKIILYGTAHTGQFFASLLQQEEIEFYGFCGRRAEQFPDGLMGKPVLSPRELAAHGDEYYVIIAVNTEKYYAEISKFLQEHNYPEEHLLGWVNQDSRRDEEQYFEFPALYRRGTAFIDGGCYDCETSYKFAQWCGGAYSSIIAFEPSPDNYAKCRKMIQDVPLPNFQLVNAGLSSRSGTAVFDAQIGGSSCIVPDRSGSDPVEDGVSHTISVQAVAIDDIVGDRTVGFIKMDIEGAEFDALHGAKNTIVRNKPLLAICVYHLQGDLFAIMDYLHQLLPEYRFWLRHYGRAETETVLYASVDTLDTSPRAPS